MAKNDPRNDDLQLEAEPLGKGWKILALVVVAIVVVAIVVMAVGIITHQ
ncbi:MAG: hypothetical protein FWD63_08485 [Propionibacteriaceae bacterium]|nr:hypothetical protein [Propionibacteriaceae bacterium]